ncbi:MAG: hypothetical protein ABJO67_20910 [Pseudoruegeria sp.]
MQIKLVGLLGVLMALMLASCSPSTAVRPNSTVERFNFSQNPAEMRRQLAGRTAKFDGPGHGTQIEFFRPNGKAYLWYPGNTVAVLSEWKIEAGATSDASASICFRYPNRSYNPVTQQFGGRWECRPSTVFGRDMTALIQGDEFNLSSGRIPRSMLRGTVLSTPQLVNLIGRPIRGEFLYGE